MPKLFTISGEWNEMPWMNTGGTRAKRYLQGPDGKFYYFKRSQIKPGKDYRFEFWSEVIAFELGSMLGFNILRYDVAVDGEVMGCICETMINSEEEELIEGVKYLQAFSPTYDPSAKDQQNRYSFQLILNSLENARLKKEIDNIIEIIVFDALIGNSDRHQENWAMISRYTLIADLLKKEEKEENRKLSKFEKRFISVTKSIAEGLTKKQLPKVLYQIDLRFAPIYDSGSSLGRELLDGKVEAFLQSDEMINRYIDKGQSEIHWEGKKLNHFELIKNLLNMPLYSETVTTVIKRVLEKWNGTDIAKIIEEIDAQVPESHNIYKIPESRKQLILKLITLRHQRLNEQIHERI